MINVRARNLLLRLRREDQRAIQKRSDTRQAARKRVGQLKQLIASHGWPTESWVGRGAAEAAWLVAQHADFDVPFQRKVLQMMKKEIRRRPLSLSRWHIAYLTDRVLVNSGRKQVFGTQFCSDNEGKMVPRPIRNERTVDGRRARYGLPPIKYYARLLTRWSEARRRRAA